MSIPNVLKLKLEQSLSSSIGDTKAVGGGCISNACVVELSNGESVFIKWNSKAPRGLFSAEAVGLSAIAVTGAVRTPNVVAVEEAQGDCPGFLALEVLEPGSKSANAEAELGRQLASMHRCTAESYGFSTDNFIGSLPQDNEWKESWPEFFIEKRLLPQIEIGKPQAGIKKQNTWVDANFLGIYEKAEKNLRDMLDSADAQPSLLHGDLWSGNVFWSNSGPVLIDPAVYYGHREADLAFTEMFGGFSQSFYREYNNCWPLSPGYHERKKVLNIYHLMTHSNLFGGSYISQLNSAVREFV